ncbi:unnamed protein product [Ostreobium quekettii]|uniref:Potassium channel tetramerisation-type BTB domain-containing protein n=1 Tax=Ostreobium quekettii TaxID=121088 RepID=A0A8S1IU63_9CHLO|nr:unnamed protein product [Ostreobium quekettii]|eukprot:evm.model.scf_30EXC.2 EVM.evm.TU.scf_30EXC.2   scf_30EXC:31683-36220(+)
MADHNRLRDLVSEVTAEFTQKKQLLEETERRLAAAQEQLEAEKHTMEKVKVSDNDIVYLNVGGRTFATKRTSLMQVKGSVLELLFSGRWEDRLDRDASGNVFFDYDPDLFNILLRFLVCKARYGEAAENLSMRPVPWEQEDEFRLMLTDLGLENLISPQPPFRFSPILKTKRVNISMDGAVATCDGHDHVRHHVFSDNVYSSSVFRFRIRVESCEDWVMLGIIAESTPVAMHEDTCTKETSYGWGCNGEVFVDGEEASRKGYPGRKISDEMELDMVLDCRYNFVALLAPVDGRMLEYKIPNLPPDLKWRVQVATYYGESSVRISSA